MKRAFCRAEELIYLGLNMHGLHQGFPILWDEWAGGVGQAGVPSTLDTVCTGASQGLAGGVWWGFR